jgi:hypothetical protein
MSIENQSGPDADKLKELEQLLAREQAPSPLARARFVAALQQEVQRPLQAVVADAGLAGFFRSLWPARPAWGMGYSAALLALGMLAGQMLPPHSMGMGAEPERQTQVCAVPPVPVNCVAGQDKC